MPDRDVQTIQDLIYYQYAKIITKKAFSVPDGQAAKNHHYGFIKKGIPGIAERRQTMVGDHPRRLAAC